jgi:hypothetical protein
MVAPTLRVAARKPRRLMARVGGMPMIDIEQTRNQARALLDSRIESVTTLVKTRQRITDLRVQLTEAEREDKRAYVRATKDGWSPEELKKLGLESGAAARRRKPATTPHSTEGSPSSASGASGAE